MRRPTPWAELHAAHAQSLEYRRWVELYGARAAARLGAVAIRTGRRRPAPEDEPQCGWWRRRFVFPEWKDGVKLPGGPWVPVLIWCEQVVDEHGELVEPEELRCLVGDRPADPARHWRFCEPITEAEYHRLLELHRTDPAYRATHARIDPQRRGETT